MKLKTCRECKQDLPLTSFTSTQAKFCNNCRIIVKLRQRNEMTNRSLERTKTKKQKTKGIIRISDLKKKAQKVFNKWIRERDAGEPCLACGRHSEDMDASHYIAQGSSGALRYCEDNVWNTCTACNRYKHGNLILYRIGLVDKIGEERVKYLEKHMHDIKKWTREELNEIIEKYKL